MKLRSFDDTTATRKQIFSAIKHGFENSFPIDGRFVRINIKDVKIPEKTHRRKDEKKAKLLDRDLTVPVTGTMELIDKKSGQKLQERKLTLGQLPYLTSKFGTFIGKGTDFSVANQKRLLPGAYTRAKSNGEIETQFNVQGNIGFRVAMDPSTAVFKLNVGANKLPLYPILKSIGIPDERLKDVWGKEILEKNITPKTDAVDKFYKKIAGYNALPNLSFDEQGREITKHLKSLRMNPNVNMMTLKKPYENIEPQTILDSTGKILKVFSGKESTDDRDSIVFKSFHGIEDFLKERIEKDSGKIAKKLAYKLDTTKDLSKVPSGYFSKYMTNIVRGDSRAFPLEEINPIQLYDSMHRNIVTGEGGIGSMDMVTREARNVHPSQFGFIDPIRGPESENIGIDTRLALHAKKGDDKKLYSRFINAKTGKAEYLSPDQAYSKTIAFPQEIGAGKRKQSGKSFVRAMHAGKIKNTAPKNIEYYMEDPEEMFSVYSALVPMKAAVQGNRLFMAGKILSDTLPLVDKEAPIVRSKTTSVEEDKDFETLYGKKVLSEISPVDGKIAKITRDEIIVKDKENKKHIVDLFDNYPLSRKTMIHNTPTIKVGDTVNRGQVIAESNYTNKDGTMAVGKHLRTAFIPLRGLTFEDGIVISDSAAKKLTSEQLYKYEVPIDETVSVGKNSFSGYFPTIYKREQAEKIDELGIPKPGTRIQKGDPLVLAIKKKTLTPTDMALGKLHKNLKNKYDDISIEWGNPTEGEVVDAVVTNKKAKVYVKSKTPMNIGDKLSGRYGNKGVISAILPDHEMPLIKRTGERLEVALNPMGIISRINPAQIWEGLLGKIGKEKGKIYRMPGFPRMQGTDAEKNFNISVKEELKKHGIPDQETLIDPKEGELETIVTLPYFYKLSQMAKDKMGARSMSSYTSNMQPVKGKIHGGTEGIMYSTTLLPIRGRKLEGGAIKIGADLVQHLLAHGARHNLRDFTLIKGQKNDDYWRAMTLGYPLPTPDVPFVYKKFEAMLKGAGANVEKTGDMINIKPMTSTDIDKLSHGEIKNARFISAKTMEPESGGLFDFGITGGPSGDKWSHISLAEPMPNPMMEDPLKSILGLNQKQYEGVISGKLSLNGETGTKAIKNTLSKIDVNNEIDSLKKQVQIAPKSKKDKLVKKLKFMIGIKRSGKRPEDFVLSKFPVIPPIYRPISMLGEKGSVAIADANKLYRDLFHSNEILKDLRQSGMPDSALAEEKQSLYDSIKATAGIGDPISIKNQQSDVKGFIKQIVGPQPKRGFFFEKVISKAQDFSARGVAVPDSSLNIDELGIPEKMAWKLYEKYIIKELVTKRGVTAVMANEMIQSKHPLAKNALDMILKERPILMNRAPSLHRFAIMAFEPKIVKHDAIATSPPITGPYNLDYDGDALQLFVPASEAAVKEAREKMMPSKNLFSIKDYGAHYKPPHEDVHGLFIASSEKGDNKPVKFNNAYEVEMALKRGEIDYDTVIEVG